METVKIVECPRDAWQGLPHVIPTDVKVTYLLRLFRAGFRHLDAVSFVSPTYVPQMADSEAVMANLMSADLHGLRPLPPPWAASDLAIGAARLPTGPGAPPRPPAAAAQHPEVIGIVVNEQGLERALKTPGVTTIGYPYSVSANFRRQNANMSLSESRALVGKLQAASTTAGRKLVVYISMAFGNPYGEPWGPEIVRDALVWLKGIGVKTVSLADTVGHATPEEVGDLFRQVREAAKGVELGAHLHSRPDGSAEKVLAAYEAGCRRFDSTLTGLGGCPFAADELVGNIATEVVVSTLHAHGATTGIEPWALLSAVEATMEIRRQYAEHDTRDTQRPRA
jgi:hydroxymethylglutaryl-CoA lyase